MKAARERSARYTKVESRLALASSMNFEMTTGWSLFISVAMPRNSSKSAPLYATFMAAPLSTYDGRTRQGKPTCWQNLRADCK